MKLSASEIGKLVLNPIACIFFLLNYFVDFFPKVTANGSGIGVVAVF